MTEDEFSVWIIEAEALHSLSDQSGYYEGYIEGLRRAHQQEALKMGELGGVEPSDDQVGSEHRRGYIDGLRGIRPCLIHR